MLTAKNCTGSGAVKYFTEYYERGQTRWYGKGASALGLEGEIERESFENVCYGKSPDGSEYLGTKGDPEKRRAGTDFTFSAPKSVSHLAIYRNRHFQMILVRFHQLSQVPTRPSRTTESALVRNIR